jgi:RNA polymerase sigma factor (sigma-70 family)
MDDSDEALMVWVARGDERAFGELARRHVPAMLGLARRILGNAAEAEDVAQETVLRVWTQALRWQPLAALRTWLSRVVVNLCFDRKCKAPWVELEAAGELLDPAPLAGESAEAATRHGDRRPAGAPARRDRAQLHRGPEQCPGGGRSRYHSFGGGNFAGARQAEPAPRAR